MKSGYVSVLLNAGLVGDLSICAVRGRLSSNCFLPPLACPRWLLALSVPYPGFIHILVLIQDRMGAEQVLDG